MCHLSIWPFKLSPKWLYQLMVMASVYRLHQSRHFQSLLCLRHGMVVLPLKGDEFSDTSFLSEGVLCGEGFCGANANVPSSSPFFPPSISSSLFFNAVIHTCTSHYRGHNKPECLERHCFCEEVWSFDAGWRGIEVGQSPMSWLELSYSRGTVWQPTINESQ